ncbi:MAG: signal peptidase I [Nocardiaceae bacterium]|nr:signal peptidase I [Nocardiaceae bacterium]
MKGLRIVAIGMALCLAAIAAVAAGVFTLSRRIDGESMEPTLLNGDRVFLTSIDAPERFSIVIGQFTPTGAKVVKRIIGLPGDTVEIDKWSSGPGTVRVQPGSKGPWFEVRNPAWDTRWTTVGSNCCDAQGKLSPRPRTQIVPPGKVFVLGDNIGASEDSRKHGWFPIDLIDGAVSFRALPLSEFGSIESGVTLVPAKPE